MKNTIAQSTVQGSFISKTVNVGSEYLLVEARFSDAIGQMSEFMTTSANTVTIWEGTTPYPAFCWVLYTLDPL